MQQVDKIKEYKDLVCSQIRWKRAHYPVSKELENHILDQRDVFLGDGDDEETATLKAIKEMGDPILVGTQFDHAYQPKSQTGMILLTVSLLVLSLLIQLFILNDKDYPFNLPKQVLATGIGLLGMFIIYYKDVTFIGRYPKLIYSMAIVLSILLLFFSIEINGQPYFAFFISFSGTYLTLIYPLALVGIIYLMKRKGYFGLILTFLTYISLLLVSLKVSSMGGVFMFALTGLLLITIAIHKNIYGIKRIVAYIITYLSIILVSMSLFIGNTYYLSRIKLALDPSIESSGRGYLSILTSELLRNSKLVGRGTLPEQFQSSSFPMPNIDTDYLLTYLIFNIGWIAFYVIVGLLALFIIKGFILCRKQKSILGTLVSTAIVLTLSCEILFYIMWNLGFQLISPIALPLISYGNVATIINLLLIGIMFSIFRNGHIINDNELMHNRGRFISYHNGRLIIDFYNKL